MKKKTNHIAIFCFLLVLTLGAFSIGYVKQLGTLFAEGLVPNPGHSLSEIEDSEKIATKVYVNDAIAGIKESNWEISGSNIYRLNGNVGIGIATPSVKLHVNGNIKTGGSIYDALDNLIYDNSTKQIPRERLPFNEGDIISTAGGSYNVANLIPSNIKSGIAYGDGQTGALSLSYNCTRVESYEQLCSSCSPVSWPECPINFPVKVLEYSSCVAIGYSMGCQGGNGWQGVTTTRICCQ